MNPSAPEHDHSRWDLLALARPASRLSLTWRFGLVAFVAIAALGFVLMEVLSTAIVNTTLEDARAEARDSVRRLVLNHLSPDDLAAPLTGERLAEFEHVAGDVLDTGRTARIKIWNTEGRIVIATNGEQVGQVFPIDEELQAALAGRTVSELTDGTKAENADLADSGPLLEVYTPIVFLPSQAVVGAFEIYQFYAPVERQIAGGRQQLALAWEAG